MRPRPIGPATPPDDTLVARFAAYLAAVANADSAQLAERRFDRVLDRAERSSEASEAAWAAAQRLRDLDDIDTAEAAYVFHSIFDLHAEALCKADREYQRVVKAYVASLQKESSGDARSEQFTAKLTRRTYAIESEFLAARGESALAALCRDDSEAFELLCAEGSLTLTEDKPPADEGRVAPASEAVAARIGERILALAATETIREALREQQALYHVIASGDPASAV